MHVLLIDNYDSFTYNLYHYLCELGADVEVEVVRNDKITVDAALDPAYEAIVISPGPGVPETAGIIVDLIRRANGTRPILGVCLGHQAIACAYGGSITRAPRLMHGKTSAIAHDGTGLFEDLPSPLQATRYHSLAVDRKTLPEVFVVNAEVERAKTTSTDGDLAVDNVPMAMHHRTHPVFGVQFHPESIASEHGMAILQRFLQSARHFNRRNR